MSCDGEAAQGPVLAGDSGAEVAASMTNAMQMPEIITMVALKHINDVQALKSMKATCRLWRDVLQDENFWKELCIRRFGSGMAALEERPTGCPLRPWQGQFVKLSRTRNAMQDSERGYVIWGENPNYFRWEVVEGSYSARCAVLHNVCWLELATTFLGVMPGEYRLVWRMRVARDVGTVETLSTNAYITEMRDVQGAVITKRTEEPPRQGDDTYARVSSSGPGVMTVRDGVRARPEPAAEPVDVSAEGFDGVLVKSKLVKHTLEQLGARTPGGWVELEIGRFKVPEGRVLDIKTHMFDLTNWWKHGIAWDCVWLEDASQPVPEDSSTGSRSDAPGSVRGDSQQGGDWFRSLCEGYVIHYYDSGSDDDYEDDYDFEDEDDDEADFDDD